VTYYIDREYVRKEVIFRKRINEDMLYYERPRYTYVDDRPSNHEILIEFMKEPAVAWLIENGIPLSTDQYKNAEDFSRTFVLIGTFNAQQYEQWREYKIIDKLENSW
jgi:hypothetical protein